MSVYSMKFTVPLKWAAIAFAALCASAGAATVALAQKDNSPLLSTLAMQRVVKVDGKEVLEPAPTVKPGEVLEYRATFTNVSKESIRQLQAVIPVPANTEFISGSETAGAQASVDGVKYAPQPLKRKIKAANGAEVEETVPSKEYRSLRWNVVELAAGKSVSYVARVKVRDDRVSDRAQAPGVSAKS
jgi:uncharacterized repeat protein (TIGR01451 family)